MALTTVCGKQRVRIKKLLKKLNLKHFPLEYCTYKIEICRLRQSIKINKSINDHHESQVQEMEEINLFSC